MFEKEFFAHGGPYLYEPLEHISFMIHEPGQKLGGTVETLGEPIDLAPTMMDYAGLAIPPWVEWASLLPAYRPGDAPGKPKFSMWLEKNKTSTIRSPQGRSRLSRRLQTELLSENGLFELYNLKLDPRQTNDLARVEVSIADRLRSMIQQ